MNLSKLARWASVIAFSTIVPAAALATTHHARLTHSTTAPSSLSTGRMKAAVGRKAVVSKLTTRGIKAKQLKTTKHKSVALKSNKAITSKPAAHKHLASKLTTKKHAVSSLTAKHHVTSKLTTTKAKTHALSAHKATAKPTVKPVAPIAPTM
jgi:hypothetical protein